jgi:hypothetical protein
VSDAAGNKVSLSGVPSGVGTATGAASGGTVTVTVNGVDVQMLAARGVTFASGEPVPFIRVGGLWVALGLLGTAALSAPASPNPTPPPPKPTTVTGSKTFTPVETRSRQGSKWRTDNDDVYQGEYGGNGNHTGCAFYGSGPRSLAGATVTSARIKVQRKSAGGITAAQTTTLRLVTEKTRPSGAPTLGSTTTGPSLRWGQAATFTVPTAWAQAMVDGTAGGLAIFESDGDPYVILDGRGRYASSFALTVNYSRTL